jgi:hypothetical protein
MARNYKAEYEGRNARARALGYKGYYDYRAHDNGRIPPSRARVTGDALAKARGHRSRADLIADSRDGLLTVERTERDQKTGRITKVDLLLIDKDGKEKRYTLRRNQLTTKALARLVEDLDAQGVIFSPSPSLDLRRLSDNPDYVGAE